MTKAERAGHFRRSHSRRTVYRIYLVPNPISVQVTCSALSTLAYAVEDWQIPGTARRRTVPEQAQRLQRGEDRVLDASAPLAGAADRPDPSSLDPGHYQWPFAVELPVAAPPSFAYRGLWPDGPDRPTADAMCAPYDGPFTTTLACGPAEQEPLDVVPGNQVSMAPLSWALCAVGHRWHIV